MIPVLLALHLLATLAMTGVIWAVQLIIYPLMDRVQPEGFAAFHRTYTYRITALVAVLMPLELGTGILLLIARPDALPGIALWAGLMLILVAWASTALLQVPQHGILARGYDAETHHRLVHSNWIRTIAWSLRTALWTLVLIQIIPS